MAIGDKITWHWSGFRFHVECLPIENQLMDQAKKDLGNKPKDISDPIWMLMLQDKQRQIMTECFLQYANSDCCSCEQKKAKKE